MESYWQSNPVRKVRKCLTFLEKSAEEEFTQNNWQYLKKTLDIYSVNSYKEKPFRNTKYLEP